MSHAVLSYRKQRMRYALYKKGFNGMFVLDKAAKKDSKYFEKDGTNSQYSQRGICYNFNMLNGEKYRREQNFCSQFC